MSGFDKQPFGEPELNNPFADPSVVQATRSSTVQGGLDDYNPFSNDGGNKTSAARGAANPPHYQPPMSQNYSAGSQPAVMQPTPEPPPAYTQTAQQKITTDELQRRQEELERKAAELQRKEEALRNAPYGAPPRNNWPPLPEKFCVGPCFYQDINVEIPLEFQKLVRTMYYLWMFHTCVMFLNVLGGLAIMIKVSGGGATFGLALFFFFLFTPASYLCWFRPIYKAFKSDSSFNFFVFFFIFFFQCITTGLFAIGFPGWGAGFISGLMTLQASSNSVSNYAVGGIILLIGFLFAVACLGDCLILLKVHRLYRNTGASFAKAQQEFASGVLRNEHVQNAAANAASTAVRQQMAGGDNRY
uniref:Secretory carrier-associated membrane protein n=1 Tax=Strigamia maritima TaxID=126957 RepID=T1IWS0_STRMM